MDAATSAANNPLVKDRLLPEDFLVSQHFCAAAEDIQPVPSLQRLAGGPMSRTLRSVMAFGTDDSALSACY
jgi:hypothetical protein